MNSDPGEASDGLGFPSEEAEFRYDLDEIEPPYADLPAVDKPKKPWTYADFCEYQVINNDLKRLVLQKIPLRREYKCAQKRYEAVQSLQEASNEAKLAHVRLDIDPENEELEETFKRLDADYKRELEVFLGRELSNPLYKSPAQTEFERLKGELKTLETRIEMKKADLRRKYRTRPVLGQPPTKGLSI